MLWPVVALVAGLLAGMLIGRQLAQSKPATAPQPPPDDTLIENLKATNALLRTLAGSPDIARSLFELALRIRAIVPCDRVGLALRTEDGAGYITYTARIDQVGTSGDSESELHFPRGSSMIDEVVSTREPRIVEDVSALAPTYLDVNVLKTAGFHSFVLVPLMFEGDALGTLTLVARRRDAFTTADVQTLRPVAEALASAYGTRRLANAYARSQMGRELSELTFAFSNDMSGAVQAIIGQCELLARERRDATFERELAGMLQQARRLREILTQMQRMTREKVATSTRPQ
jgi:transcriptional regulator with GAF, ATPase, and Fis domain